MNSVTGKTSGLLTYIRGDIVQRKREDFEIDCKENGRIESFGCRNNVAMREMDYG